MLIPMLMMMLTTKVWDIMSAIALSQWSTTFGTPRLVLLIITIIIFMIITIIICIITIIIFMIIIILDAIASPSPDAP